MQKLAIPTIVRAHGKPRASVIAPTDTGPIVAPKARPLLNRPETIP